jgi:tetratricopeptide (TPR) repeat protein
MKISTSVIAIAVAGFAVSAPASAQIYGKAQKKDPEEEVVKPAEVTLPSGRKATLSQKAGAAIVELQKAVTAKDAAAIPAKLAAAQQAAKSNDEKYLVALLQVQAAMDANDMAGIEAGTVALQASGSAANEEVASRWAELGRRLRAANQMDQAASALDKALALNPNHVPSLKMLGLTREAQGRKAEAVAAIQKALASAKASGQAVPEDEYKYAVAMAHTAKLPIAYAAARDWVAAYPTSKNWHDALRVHREIAVPKGDLLIDNMRLAAATGGLETEAEFHQFASALVARGLTAEAKAVLEAGAAAKKIDLSSPVFKEFAAARSKPQTRAQVDAAAKSALAGASAKAAIDAGDAYYGLGAYAEAAAAYQAALSKSGVDSNLANLRLGMALARSGDKAGATAALNAVGGVYGDVAKYWLVWTASRA